MSWNPKSGIAFFEPGCVKCAYCNWKPEDPWCDAPEGFKYIDGEWLCDECRTELPEFVVCGNPSESEIAGVRE